MAKPQASLLLRRMQSELDALASQSQLRRLEILGGVHRVNLSSNDYLGLATDRRLREALAAALAAGSPVGSTGSRLLSGNSPVWEELEAELAEFAGAEAVLYFGSGYAANIGLFSSVLHPGDVVFSDSANHASIIDGIRLSGARKIIFPHLDLDFLERELRKEHASPQNDSSPAQKIIAVESVFSMDGDRAPVADLLALAERYNAQLIFDEAHATGVLGPQGRGLVAAAGATDRVLAVVHTSGKALAGMGAFVCGSRTLKEYLINRARTFIFATALPPYMAAQMRAAIRIAAGMNRERAHLAHLAQRLRDRLRAAGFDTGRSESHIVPVILGDNERALQFAAALSDQKFVVRAIRPPTVAPGIARLRLSLHANLGIPAIDRLADALIQIRENATPTAAGAATK
jgi:8-amino-7-oxononanoate synthase